MLKSVVIGKQRPIDELVTLAVTRQHDEADRQRALSFLFIRTSEITAADAEKMMAVVPRMNPRGMQRIICRVVSQCYHLPDLQRRAKDILAVNQRQRIHGGLPCLLPRGD